MNTYANKAAENNKNSLAKAPVQKQGSGAAPFSFADHRPQAVAQRKLNEMVANSPQAKQAAQLQAMADIYVDQQQQPIQKKANTTGLPDSLKAGVENLSGYAMDDVRVHYNSSQPAQLQAHAYAQGTDIHVAPGQEKHLPHEAWHVVQQKQGRVKPTLQMKGNVNINDDVGLEKEADEKGLLALRMTNTIQQKKNTSHAHKAANQNATIQCLKVKGTVDDKAVVIASKSKRWMINQGMNGIGYKWHMTIFPSNQASWTGTYKLPAKGKRGIADWMEFSEFHITTPGSEKHFFYNENLAPLNKSMESFGRSQPWTDSDWSTANRIVALWFKRGIPGYNWLQNYVAQRPEGERLEALELAKEKKYQEDLWALYKNFLTARVGGFSKGPPDYEEWVSNLERSWEGSRDTLMERVREDAISSKNLYVQQGPWKEDEKGSGFEWETHWVKGGTITSEDIT